MTEDIGLNLIREPKANQVFRPNVLDFVDGRSELLDSIHGF